jgi:hypothetical protein
MDGGGVYLMTKVQKLKLFIHQGLSSNRRESSCLAPTRNVHIGQVGDLHDYAHSIPLDETLP